MLVDRRLDDGYLHLAVLDISAVALERALRSLGERATTVDWICADVMRYVAPRQFDLRHDWAARHVLVDAEDQRAYADAWRRSLTSNGQVIIASCAVRGPTRCSGLEVVQHDAKRLKALLGDHFRLSDERCETHLTPDGTEQKFA